MWSSNRVRLAVLVLAIVAATAASAGSFRVVLAPAGTGAFDWIDLDGPKFQFAQGNGKTRSYILEKDAFSGALDVAVADGHDQDVYPFRMSINVPYSWGNAPAKPILVALVKRNTMVGLRLGILRSVGTRIDGSPSDQMVLNQEARVVAEDIMDPNRVTPLTGEDFRLVLYFLTGSKEFVLNKFVEPDDDMVNAAAFLDSNMALAETPDIAATANQVIANFRQAHRHQLEQVAFILDVGMSSPYGEVRTDTCGKAQSLNNFVTSLAQDPEAQADFDPIHFVEVKVVRDLVACLSPSLRWTAGMTQESIAGPVATARALRLQMRTALDAYQVAVSDGDRLIPAAKRDIATLCKMVEDLTALVGSPAPADCEG